MTDTDHLSTLHLVRGIDLGLAGVLIALALALPARGRRAFLPLVLCLVSYLLRSAPEAAAAPLPLLVVLSIGALLFPMAFWWLLHNVFDDRTDLPPWAWACGAALLFFGLMPPNAAGLGVAPHVLQKLLAAGFVVTALWRLVLASADDLIAARRSLRVWLLGYIGAHGLVVLAVELWLGGQRAPAWLDTLNLGVIALAQGATLAFLLRPNLRVLETLFGRPPPMPAAAAPAEPAATEDRDATWLARLDHLMRVERVYREPELTLALLADKAGLPEYRLRELINQRLGYRNFPTYLNEQRLQEVEARLADPACDGRPILTLALEAGFGSIGPFNRAFRDRHGVTPSDFRAARKRAAASG
ncbi:MAG TPA: helix-turn-helix domain-containing protein [Rhizobacter sp.]